MNQRDNMKHGINKLRLAMKMQTGVLWNKNIFTGRAIRIYDFIIQSPAIWT